jgi:hypothetical protein
MNDTKDLEHTEGSEETVASVTSYLQQVGGYCKPVVGRGAPTMNILLMSDILGTSTVH